MSSFDKLLARKLEDAEVRSAYEDAVQRRRLIRLLVEARKEQGLTQVEVARRMGVGQSTVAGFESAESDPRVGTLQRYARAVNRRLDGWVTTPLDARFATRNPDQGRTTYLAEWGDQAPVVVTRTTVTAGAIRADFALAG